MHLSGLLPTPIRSGYRTARLEFQKAFLGKKLSDPFHARHHRTRIVYIHIPKTGGNSVTKLIYDCPSMDRGGHACAHKFRDHSLRLFHKYFFFAFVRNPY